MDALGAPARVVRRHIPDKGGTGGRGASGLPRATPPERAESCAMPAKNGRGLDEQDCVTASWRHSRREDNHEALPGSPPNTTGELPLCDDKLLTKKRVLRDQVYAAANEIRGHPGNEPKKVDHVSVLHCLRADGICTQDGDRSTGYCRHATRDRQPGLLGDRQAHP